MPERGTLDISKAKDLIGYSQKTQLKLVIKNILIGIKNSTESLINNYQIFY